MNAGETPGGWTFRDLDRALGLARGSAFRLFKALRPRLRPGRDFLHVDAAGVEALRAAGRLYPRAVRAVLVTASGRRAMEAAIGAGGHAAARAVPIGVLGATGTVGTEVVRALAAQGARVHALARHAPETAWPPGVRFFAADIMRAESLAPALEGVAALFLLTPLAQDMVEVAGRVLAAARAAGIGRVVRLSAFGADDAAPGLLGRVHAQVEGEVRRVMPQWTLLRPNAFMQNYRGLWAAGGTGERLLATPQGAGEVSLVDARDVGEVAARALLDAAWGGSALELTGPEALGEAAVVSAVTGIRGVPVRRRRVSAAAMRAELAGHGLDRWVVEVLLDLYEYSRAGRAARVSPDVARVLGRAPRGLEAVLRRPAEDALAGW